MIDLVVGNNLRIVRCIANGGTGSVYEAVEPSAAHRVAVKILDARSAAGDDAYRCFRNEVLSLARVTHPHAVRLYDWGRAPNGHWFIAMELLEGRSLDEVLKDEGPLSPERCLEILEDVAAVLEEAHDLGIVHRDIKPPNIFLQRVGDDEFVRLLDFGIARLLNQPAGSDRPSGTPAYMAPEQIRGVDVDGRADIYALGAVAYECLGGRPPFDDGTPVTLMTRQITEPPKPLTVPLPDARISPKLVELIHQMMEKRPEDRPATIREVRARIRVFRELLSRRWVAVGTTDLTGPADASDDVLAARAIDRRPAGLRIALLGALACLVVIGLTVVAQSRGDAVRAAVESAPAAAVDPPETEAPEAQEEATAPLPTPPRLAAAPDAGLAPEAAPAPPPARFTAAAKVPRAPRTRALRACYELMGPDRLAAPKLLIDGGTAAANPKDRCFSVQVRLGTHAFTLVDGHDVAITVRQEVTPATEGVFFLVE